MQGIVKTGQFLIPLHPDAAGEQISDKDNNEGGNSAEGDGGIFSLIT